MFPSSLLSNFIVCAIIIALTLRCMISVWGYSGYNKPIMYGDFEAQRHWMEITISLPIGDWYRNTNDNDLQYWGLDYPPLTAYVSQMFGMVANKVHPPLVQLYSSRGHESYLGKLFMRMSVLMCDFLIYFPTVLLWTERRLCSLKHISSWSKSCTYILPLTLLVRLSIPALLLIDHGHFQYNCVCLGLALLGGLYVVEGKDILGSILFCLSLNFKQMSLYYAPVFFFYLLRKCLIKGIHFFIPLLRIGLSVIITFAMLWLPFCIYASEGETCSSSLLHVLSRQFPFSRGLFEDKVANLWYMLSIIVDLRQLLPMSTLVQLSLVLTLTLLSPVAMDLLRRRASPVRFLLALCNSSLAFFLASFQVHEKSLLLMLTPASMLLADDLPTYGWLQVLGVFSMFPLLERDGLSLPYWACTGLFLLLVSFLHDLSPTPLAVTSGGEQGRKGSSLDNAQAKVPAGSDWTELKCKLKVWFITASYTGMLLLHLLQTFIPPPRRYPDLYPALFSIFGALNLTVVYLYGVVWQLTLND